jgi:transcriptional/translational regulatory protein YebC/TACO1
MFEQKGFVIVSKNGADEDDVFLVAADAGAEDVRGTEESIEVMVAPEGLKSVRGALEEAGVEIESAEVTQVPKSTVRLEGAEAKKLLHLIENLEDLDDVQDVYANFDIPDDVLASVAS